MTVTVPNHNYSTGPIDRVCSRLLLWLLQFVHPVVHWNIQKKPFRLNINGTFRYNTSAEHEGRARTIHTSGLKCKNKQKKTFTIYRWQGGDHYVQALHMQWRLARPKVYTQQCRTPLKATVIHFDNRFFGKIKKLGAASTNTDENKKPTKVTHEIMNLVRFCTDAHSLHQFILSCCATPTGKGGEQKGEEFPLYT